MIGSFVWTPLHARIHRVLRARHLLGRGQHILIAVSGGQDSLCLAKVLLDLQPKWGWTLGIAHLDHRWRGDSAANADYVEQVAATWQLPCYRETATQVATSEAAARQWRYSALADIAQTHGYTCLVTGHTASDRAETLLYNLIRGSGADGLQALTWRRSLTPTVELVRPLLDITRGETEAFCREFHLKIWEDSTNQDTTYARNRIRQELLPYLKHGFNPQVELNLAQTAELLQAEVDYLEQVTEQVRYQAQHPERPGLSRLVLRSVPLAIQRRVVRQFLTGIMSTAPNFEHIEKVVELVTAANRSRTDPLPGGAIAEVDSDWIWLVSQQGSKF